MPDPTILGLLVEERTVRFWQNSKVNTIDHRRPVSRKSVPNFSPKFAPVSFPPFGRVQILVLNLELILVRSRFLIVFAFGITIPDHSALRDNLGKSVTRSETSSYFGLGGAKLRQFRTILSVL